jgi:hypothetical protein
MAIQGADEIPVSSVLAASFLIPLLIRFSRQGAIDP